MGSYTYIHFTDPLDHTGKHWERIPTACVLKFAIENGFTAATPQQMLAEIKKADNKVTVVGPASGPGWTGTRYAFHSKPRAWGEDQLSGTVDVDQQGRARALVLTIRSTNSATNLYVMTQDLTFSDFGLRRAAPTERPCLWPAGAWSVMPVQAMGRGHALFDFRLYLPKAWVPQRCGGVGGSGGHPALGHVVPFRG